ncbi:hypothetical protein AK812_SmicGene7465 [Symbiodinium microadriaticum]|uniref:Uncharacterized protein n=1 Tax=Symbiodinium microadriaticum TaxID=2951 RepID=A0A1Q9ENJ0_SYMMI|nr:hypothetical protein AK812_SmicGene7465 [Symbiodinium microadriaticum]
MPEAVAGSKKTRSNRCRPVEELRRFPNLDNQKPEEKNDKNDPQVSQENEGVIECCLTCPTYKESTQLPKSSFYVQQFRAKAHLASQGRTQSSTPEASPGPRNSDIAAENSGGLGRFFLVLTTNEGVPTLRPSTFLAYHSQGKINLASRHCHPRLSGAVEHEGGIGGLQLQMRAAEISLPHAVPTDVEVDSTPTLPPTLASVEVEVPAELVTEMEARH